MLQIKFEKIALTYFGYFFHKNILNQLFETLMVPTCPGWGLLPECSTTHARKR